MKNVDQDLLITRYLDDQASEEELQLLNDLLESDPEARERYLSATTQAFLIAQGVTKLEQAEVKPFPRNKVMLFAAIAACVTFLLAVMFSDNEKKKGIAKLVESGGGYVLPNTDHLVSGDTIKTLGSRSFLKMEFSDGTLLHLVGDTSVTVVEDQQKKLILHKGAVTLDVKPQPDEHPLTVVTPAAELTVKGTSFNVLSTNSQTHLEVAEGSVAFKRLIDGDSVVVDEGHYSIADNHFEKLWVRPTPSISENWQIDFKTVSLDLLDSGLKDKYGVREDDSTGVTGVSLLNAWKQGDYAYFQLGRDATCKIRFKMDTPSWFNVVVLYRSPEKGSIETQTCLYNNEEWWKGLKPGEWRTIEVPLTNPQFTENELPMEGDVPIGWYSFALSISSGNESRGLVVETIEVK